MTKIIDCYMMYSIDMSDDHTNSIILLVKVSILTDIK